VWDEFPEGWPEMEFRLVYEGPLKAAGTSRGGNRVPEKHAIRKSIHPQVKRLWDVVPFLSLRKFAFNVLNPGSRNIVGNRQVHTLPSAETRESLLTTLGRSFNRCGYEFVPLVSNHLKLACALDILFLRRDMPGVPLIHSGGDIDNRLKVLFDALRIPENCEELTGTIKGTDEDPYFFCLLEDDALITEVNVTTDNLLTPCSPGEEHHVHLVIRVKVRPTDLSFENYDFM
jgi:hypothetical protein